MVLSEQFRKEISRWIENIKGSSKTILTRNADVQMQTDASMEGWGVICGQNIWQLCIDMDINIHISHIQCTWC